MTIRSAILQKFHLGVCIFWAEIADRHPICGRDNKKSTLSFPQSLAAWPELSFPSSKSFAARRNRAS
jgi:hypothetical protein